MQAANRKLLSPKKILICQQRQIGDVLLSTACVRLLAEKFPNAELHFLTEKKCEPVLTNNPRITKIWRVKKGSGLSGMLRLGLSLRQESFDLIIDFQQLPRLRGATLLSGAPVRLSYTPKWYNRFIYNLTTPMVSGYAVKAKASVLNPLGISWDGEPPELYLTKEEREWAVSYLEREGISSDAPFITMDPTHRHPARKWPAEYYAELITRLLMENRELRVFLLYGPGEKPDVDHIRQLADNHERCIVSNHMTSLREMAAVIERAKGQVGNCSSPRHFSVAVGTPTITIHGSTKPGAWTFPDENHKALRHVDTSAMDEDNLCVSCGKSTCALGTMECMYGVSPERVLEEARNIFFK